MPNDVINNGFDFPKFTGNETTEQKLDSMMDYVYQLQENLRYVLANLGIKNFNGTQLQKISDTITNPINVALSETDGNVAALALNTNGLTTRVGSVENNVSTLSQNVEGISLTAESATGGASLKLKNSAGSDSTVGITLKVENNEGGYSTVSMTAGDVTITSDHITLGGKVVFENGLSNGTTEINGDCIRSGTIVGVTVKSSVLLGSGYFQETIVENGAITFRLANYENNDNTGVPKSVLNYGTMYADSNNDRFWIKSSTQTVDGYEVSFPLKLESAGNLSIDAADGSTLYLGTNSGSTETINIGGSGKTVNINGTVKINGTNY